MRGLLGHPRARLSANSPVRGSYGQRTATCADWRFQDPRRSWQAPAFAPVLPRRGAHFRSDDRLVGEGLQQFNLSVGKWAHLRATQGNCPDCFASTKKGYGQYGAETETPCELATDWILVCLGQCIGKVNC